MEPRGSMPHSQGLSSNPYSEPNQPIPRIIKLPIAITLLLPYFKNHFNIDLPSNARPS